MIATTAGRAFEISGAAFGHASPWSLIKENGKPMTAEEFDALPPDARDWLVDAVREYVDGVHEGCWPAEPA